MSTGDDEQTELSRWVEAAEEGEQTLAWVKTGTSSNDSEQKEGTSEQRDRVGWMLDLVEKPKEYTSTRRVFLKLLGSTATVGGGIAIKGTAIPEVLQNFWPNALYNEEAGSMLTLSTIETLLTDHRLGWEEFKNRSTEFLYNPDVVTTYDDVHLLSVFHRAIDKEFIEAIEKSSHRANNVFVYFADPVHHQTKGTPALELHEEIELRSFRHLFYDTTWSRFYNEVVKHPANDKVPHPDHSKLNRIRALANALRAIQMGTFLTHTYQNVYVRLIDHHEISLRGRLIGDHHASFLLNPKATIGTTPPRAGFITRQDPIISELHEERERISNKRTYDLVDLVNLSREARDRGQRLLDATVSEGVISSNQVTEIADNLDALTIDGTSEFDTVDDWIGDREEKNRKIVNNITEKVNKLQFFTEPQGDQGEVPPPNDLYESMEQRVLRDFQ